MDVVNNRQAAVEEVALKVLEGLAFTMGNCVTPASASMVNIAFVTAELFVEEALRRRGLARTERN